jgi:signal transduction histidine kinase
MTLATSSQQESLRAVIEVISSELELRPLLTTVVRHACDLLQADKGTIGLVSKDKKVIRTEAVYHMPDSELGLEMPEGVGIAGQVLQARKPVLLNRYGDAGNPIYKELLEDAVIGMPIFWHEELIGFFGIGAEPPRCFSQEDVDTLSLLARHAAIAIHNAKLFAETQQALGDTQLLFETSQRMSMALDIDGVVEAYLQHVATRQRYRCTVATFEENGYGDKTTIVTLGRWLPHEGLTLEKVRFPYFQDDFDAQLEAGQTVIIKHVSEDPRVSNTLLNTQLEKGYPALALIPLIVRGKRIGVVSLSYETRHDWTEIDLRPYQVTATQLATTLSSRQQQQQLLENEQRIAVLEERQRIARDLHDSVNQLIFSMTLIAQSLGSAYQKNPSEGDKRTARLLELSHMIRSEMRSLLVETRMTPDSSLAILQKAGLVKALQHHLEHLGLQVSLETRKYTTQPRPIEEALFRISQEALNNVEKHAGATRVFLTLSSESGGVYLSVQDEGVGFEVARAVSKESAIGLKSMRERAEAIGASFKLESFPGNGTRLEVRLAS